MYALRDVTYERERPRKTPRPLEILRCHYVKWGKTERNWLAGEDEGYCFGHGKLKMPPITHTTWSSRPEFRGREQSWRQQLTESI